MRILHLIPNLSGGGAEQQLCQLSSMLVQMGHCVHIAFTEVGPEMPKLDGVMLHNLKLKTNYDPCLIWQIVLLIKRIKPDLIHSWILQMDIIGGVVSWLLGVPWIIREPSSTMAYPKSWKNNLRILLASRASAIISNSKDGDDYWKNRLPQSIRHIIPNATPSNRIEKIAPAFPRGISDPKTPTILYVGRLSAGASGNKNLKYLIKTMALINQKSSVMGIICGEGPQRIELGTLIQKLGLTDHVLLTGHLPSDSVWALMKKASVFVSLSAYEGCPNTVLEAIACGCQLVLSDIPAHREIASHNGALFVTPSNIKQTANTIMKALKSLKTLDENKSIAIRNNGRFSFLDIAKRYEQVYKSSLR